MIISKRKYYDSIFKAISEDREQRAKEAYIATLEIELRRLRARVAELEADYYGEAKED